MTTLRQAKANGDLEIFIKEREQSSAPQEPLQRYIDASATPLDSRKASRSKSQRGSGGDYK